MSSHKKFKTNTHHEYTSTNQLRHGIFFRLSNYFVLLSMLGLQKIFDIQFSESVYLLVFSAIIGYDVQGLLETIKNLVGKKR